MTLKQWLVAKELSKRNEEALDIFKQLVVSSLEDKLKHSLEKGYPRFKISFSSEEILPFGEISGEDMQYTVLDFLDSLLTSENIGYSVSANEITHQQGEEHDPANKKLGREPSCSIEVRGTITL